MSTLLDLDDVCSENQKAQEELDSLRAQVEALTNALVPALDAIHWICDVNAMDYEYKSVAYKALSEIKRFQK